MSGSKDYTAGGLYRRVLPAGEIFTLHSGHSNLLILASTDDVRRQALAQDRTSGGSMEVSGQK